MPTIPRRTPPGSNDVLGGWKILSAVKDASVPPKPSQDLGSRREGLFYKAFDALGSRSAYCARSSAVI
jgi:hypothetical protein